MTRRATKRKQKRPTPGSVRVFWCWVMLAGLLAVLLMYQGMG